MTILCDSREQKWEHVRAALERLGYQTLRSKLPCGDYALMTDMSRVIDRKASLNEVESNLVHDHERFRRECELARDNGIELIVLVESGDVDALEGVGGWINPRRVRWAYLDRQHAKGKLLDRKCPGRPPVDGATLRRIMETMSERYGIAWRFCCHQDAGRAIVELLTREAEGRLGAISEACSAVASRAPQAGGEAATGEAVAAVSGQKLSGYTSC